MLFDQNGNRKYLISAERRAFLESAQKAPPKVETFCQTLAYTGARISEVLALSPERIDVAAQIVIFETLKRRRRGVYRAVPVPTEFLARLEEVHHLRQGNPQRRLWPWGRTTGWQRVKEVMAEAHVAERIAMPKALRHAFGVHGVTEAEVPLNIIGKWLGHAKIETTAIYANAVGNEERALAARMWD